MNKKIIFLTPVPTPYQIAFAEALQNHLSIEFWFLTSIRDSTRPIYWERDIPSYCRILPTRLRKQQLFFCPGLTGMLSHFNPDCIILHGKWNNISWFFAYRWAIRNHKTIIMGPLEAPTKQNWFKEVLRKLIYRKIDAYLCVGYKSLDYYASLKKENKAYMLSYAADLERELTHPLRKPEPRITFLHSGSINDRFRVQDILKTFERLAVIYPDIRLILSGSGPVKEKCKTTIQESTVLATRVTWVEVNSWEEVQDLYLLANVLISYPSYAGWGLTIPEAMASGMGIIAGNCVEAGRELIIEGYNGFLVSDNRELEQAMLSYLVDPTKASQHGAINKAIAPKEGCHEKAKYLAHLLRLIVN